MNTMEITFTDLEVEVCRMRDMKGNTSRWPQHRVLSVNFRYVKMFTIYLFPHMEMLVLLIIDSWVCDFK
jgi:hypothetical protein